MNTYNKPQEITTTEQVWINNLSTGLQTQFNFVTAGYGATANTPLSNLTYGRLLFSMKDSYGNVPNVNVGGVTVAATGLPFLLNPNPTADPYTAYIQYNISVTNTGLYTCTADFTKPSGENEVADVWRILIQ